MGLTVNVPAWHIPGMTLDDAMKTRGLTDQALADQLGVSRPYVTRIRRGERTPSVTVAAKIQQITEVPAISFAKEATP
jgi:transcriptional regulator with XRE-family HTH domain